MKVRIIVVVAAALITSAANAQTHTPQRPDEPRPVFGGLLVPRAVPDELNLSDEQRQKVRQLQQDCATKNKLALAGTALKVARLIDSLRRDDGAEPAPGLAIAHEITGGLLQARRNCAGCEHQVLAVLDDVQKRALVEVPERRPLTRRQQRLVARAGDAAPVLAPDVQRQLRLDAAQERKIAALREEMDAKVRALLTDEQRRKLDEINGRQPPKPKD